MLDTHAADAAADQEKAHFAWPRGLLLVIGLLIFTGMIAEGVMMDWCVLYLKQDLAMPQAQAALGYSAFAGAMALSRFAGDSLRARYSERSILFVGATVAAVAMAVVLLAAVPWVAMVGFGLVGAGLAPVAPILFNAATRVPGVSRAAAIASVTSIGYSGFMIGPPLIGSIAQASSLTVALGAVVLGAVCLAIGSRKVPTA
jgi:fucose permease